MRGMRAIVVDDEKWEWSLRKEPDWSEYTPCDERTISLYGPDGYLRRVHFDYDTTPVTPDIVADFIRKIREDWPSPKGLKR